MFCNASPMFRSHTVLIKSDAAFVAIMVAFSVSAGYTGNLVYIHAPKRLKADPAKEVGALLCNFSYAFRLDFAWSGYAESCSA